ncbi:protein-serine/threonine phosphatase [Ranunculus cassubicifolius]
MEEMSSAVAVPFRLGNSICDTSTLVSHMEITRLKLITNTENLLSEPSASDSAMGEDESSSSSSLERQVSVESMSGVEEDNDMGRGQVQQLPVAPQAENDRDVLIHEIDEDDNLSVEGDQILDASGPLSVLGDTSSIYVEDLVALESASRLSTLTPLELEKSLEIIAKSTSLEGPSVLMQSMGDSLPSPQMGIEVPNDGSDSKAVVVVSVPHEKKILGNGSRGILELDCLPLWGSTSICGRRPEMEDAFTAIPRLTKIPLQLLLGDHVLDGMTQKLSHATAHFYGVYDGHGGFQVANYCRDRLHVALTEEIETMKQGLTDGSIQDDRKIRWEKAFTNCFLKVDDEVGGKISRGSVEGDSEPIASETVGSTAVVAVVCSSHIIVSNCGDSRAVLCRGKEPLPLSVDHKPNRDDEYARIEAAGGKVIQWNGHRVFGVLAMSRSIGDRYLKPWIIPDPEVTFIPRMKEDECLVLASDGLWDVLTNEEVCDVARRRILLWHKKNGISTLPEKRGEGVDPAAQAAAECLSKLALQKGSKDNITVVVIDLKAQRRFKTKS